MCILFLAIQQHPQYPLIICANRDEFHSRATQSAHCWPPKNEILAGKDLQAGGSWLGCNNKGHFAAITNLRTGTSSQQNMKSRGELVTQALENPQLIDHEWLTLHSDEYSPFNLTYGFQDNLVCFNSVNKQQISLDDGFHAISNGAMDDVWPKMAQGEQQLEALLKSGDSVDVSKLLSILKDQTRPEKEQLPKTGIPDEWEQLLSSIFICSSDYGTRSSSIILQHLDKTVDFTEVEYGINGGLLNQTNFQILQNNIQIN